MCPAAPLFQPAESESITVHELAEVFDTATVLDVREPFEAQIARIPGTRLIPLAQLPLSLDSIDRDAPVVVHCHHDSRSRMAVTFLRENGFSDVRWLEGGIDAWSRIIDPAVARY